MQTPVDADYVVVGAGSAGCVLAHRLSAAPETRVLLLEAGGSDWNPVFRVPLMTGVLLRARYANWSHVTEPEAHLCGRRLSWPSGKVLGGSSSINGMVYVRGSRADYDGWARAGLAGWSFDEVLPYFRKTERHAGGPSEFHGGDGLLPVSRPCTPNPLFDAYIEAGLAAGYPYNADFNGATQEGFGRHDFTILNGERWSAARAFLGRAVRDRRNLTALPRVRLLRVVFEGSRATGVEVAVGGERHIVRAVREVVLCCGAVNSPAALLRSGIGDPVVLGRLGIPVVADLPGVGRNLRDHLLVRVQHACTQPVTLYGTMRADRAALALLQAVILKTGPAASFPLEAGAFVKSDLSLDAPDLQSHFLPALSTAALRLPFSRPGRLAYEGHGFLANIYRARPESTGEVTIRSADPMAAPVIRPNYLSDGTDLRVLREGVRILRHVFAQRAFAPWRGAELSPGSAVTSDADIESWIRQTADTVFHPIGTCRMGVDSSAVVDPQLRVRGVAGLRVVDASVMPTMPSGNTHAPTMMIAEKAADAMVGAGG